MESAAHAVVVHRADCTHWHNLEQTESVQLTHAITQHNVHKMMQYHVIVRRQSKHAHHNSIRHSYGVYSLKS